ncbi:MAG TPA: hypothetical protein VGY55_11005 [Pirellulales bacterium]|jgi:hypothetical protein|nr:hypothetical protein [Pirellulales bacterium]
MKSTSGLAIAFIFLLSSAAWADVGVFTGTGQSVKQISNESVQLVSIDVTILLERGRFLFDGGVPGLDEVEYDCRFALRNLTDKACSVQVGFPIDSQFAKLPNDPKRAGKDWVSEYSFNARDVKNTYHVDCQFSDPQKTNYAYSAIFTWMINLQAKETRALIVQYRIPMSVTLASTSKRGLGESSKGIQEHRWMQLLDSSTLEIAGYTTETGSSWAGSVEKATFKVVTAPFEKYLEHRGLLERKLDDLPADEREIMKMNYPVHYVWSFRDVQPTGWQPVEGGVKWEYKDYKPKDAITIRYFLMQFPRQHSEVDPWVDAILRNIPDPHQQAGELAVAKQILMATYGQEPTDEAARAFAEDQIWYARRKDFAISKLSKEQQAVLAAVDRRLETINKRN